MIAARQYFRELLVDAKAGWDHFWFTPSHAATLCVIRILAGAMLFYTHLIWTINSDAFFGQHSWLSSEAIDVLQNGSFAWSFLWLFDSSLALIAVHVLSLIVFACLTLGLFSRVTAVLAFLISVSYANRVSPALFGLDQINVMLAMYLMLGPAGAHYSLDRLLARRGSSNRATDTRPSVAANISIRLIQVHMCVIYLFAGLSKLQGPAWWNGTAIWGAIANLEYQSIDMTWLVNWPLLVNLLTHVTVAWEISYCVLVWNRLTRPLVLLLALPIHLGIGFCLGMMTFGTIMLVANLAFVSPQLIRHFLERPVCQRPSNRVRHFSRAKFSTSSGSGHRDRSHKHVPISHTGTKRRRARSFIGRKRRVE